MASLPSDELAERRARRDGRNVVFLGGRPGESAEARIPALQHELAVLQSRLGETVAERDRMAAVAAARRDRLVAARERESALEARVRGADGDLSRARAQLAARTASEASLRVQATGLHARIHALRARAAGHDARVSELAAVVDELSETARTAQGDVERHLAARRAAEESLAAERARTAALEDELASVRAELDGLHAARDRTLGAEEHARAARAAELAALRASSARLRPMAPGPPDASMPLDLAVDLARAAERLRAQREPAAPDAAPAVPPPAVPAAALHPPVALPRDRDPVRAGGLRAAVRRLLRRRA